MKVGIYVRVSTQQQTTENQLLELYEICERNDWTVVEEEDYLTIKNNKTGKRFKLLMEEIE